MTNSSGRCAIQRRENGTEVRHSSSIYAAVKSYSDVRIKGNIFLRSVGSLFLAPTLGVIAINNRLLYHASFLPLRTMYRSPAKHRHVQLLILQRGYSAKRFRQRTADCNSDSGYDTLALRNCRTVRYTTNTG